MPSLGNELMLHEVMNALREKHYIFFTKYQGLSAPDFVELRQKLGKVANRTLVVKNTLSRLAFKQMGIEDVNGLIKGSILLTVAEKEPQLVSKVLVDFAKGRENFEIGGAYLEGQVRALDYVKSLAHLPSREVLIASLAGGLNAPISGFVSVMGQLIRSLAIALDQIQKSKEN